MSATLQFVQEQTEQGARKAPLILIHDGGGTVFQYYMLPDLGREVYGIANPRFDDGGMWEGGVPQVARTYLEAIRETIGAGPIILGGWSFGGMISIEIARLLEDDRQIHVRGLLLIDSVCPWSSAYQKRGAVEPHFRSTTQEHIRQKTRQCFASARAMISAWAKPTTRCFTLPVVLLRADEADTAWQDQTSLSSTYDQDGRLGWSECEDVLAIRETIGVPGDHFSLWREDRLSFLASVIKDSCNDLEQPGFETHV